MAAKNLHANEGSNLFPYTLAIIGSVVCFAALLESYYQLTNQSISLLDLAHNYGFMTEYKRSVEPNKGIWHMIGWVGTGGFFMMMLYSVRKHFTFMQDVGQLRYWLDFHIFLGVTGTILVMVHTTFKVGGIVSLSFWSMVLVAGSGVIGRYIYIQIPRNITGNELRIDEIREVLEEVNRKIAEYAGNDQNIIHYFELISGPKNSENMGSISSFFSMIFNDISNLQKMLVIRRELYQNQSMPPAVKKELFKLIREKGNIIRSSNFLNTSHKLLHYWHVFHKPFAIIMFLIMFLHIAVTMVFEAH